MDDRYLGDGVYASFDGYCIVLDLRQQNTSRIALEPTVFTALLQYAEDLRAKATIDKAMAEGEDTPVEELRAELDLDEKGPSE